MSTDQIIIAVFGLLSVWLSQDARLAFARFACVFGLAAQPAWFYAAWTHEQWGVLATSVIYTAGWCRGIYNFWIKPRGETRTGTGSARR